jgi:hypothetical protein
MSTKHYNHNRQPHSVHQTGHDHTRRQLGPAHHGTEPYPYVFSSDVFDQRRFGVPGQPYGPASNLPSRAATWFAIVVIVLVLGLGLLTVIQGVVGP